MVSSTVQVGLLIHVIMAAAAADQQDMVLSATARDVSLPAERLHEFRRQTSSSITITTVSRAPLFVTFFSAFLQNLML
jgi:formate dehydrogenase maturation protein FdhE